MFYIILLL
jgi:hypothetical protein